MTAMSQLGKTLVIFGICLMILGAILWALSSLNIKGIPFGRLPGDIYIKKDNLSSMPPSSVYYYSAYCSPS